MLRSCLCVIDVFVRVLFHFDSLRAAPYLVLCSQTPESIVEQSAGKVACHIIEAVPWVRCEDAAANPAPPAPQNQSSDAS